MGASRTSHRVELAKKRAREMAAVQEKPTKVDTSDVQVALACMYVSRSDGQAEWPVDWRKRVNDVIRALRDERDQLQEELNRIRPVGGSA